MQRLVEVGLSNALAVVVLAMVAWVAGRISRRPAITHALWLLVLLKLLTPPIIELRLPWAIVRTAVDEPVVVDRPAPRAAALSINGELKRAQAKSPSLADDGNSAATATADQSRLVTQSPVDPGARGWVEQQSSAAANTISISTGRTDVGTASSDLPTSPPAAIAPEATGSIFQTDAEPWLRFGRFAKTTWLIGLIVWIVLQSLLGLRLRAILRASTPAPVELCRAADEIAMRLGLVRRPQVRIVASNLSPMLCGLGHGATILISAALLRRLGPDAQTTVLAHELCHYRRGDQWVRLVELVVTGLYWWHPLVWWARRQIEIAEEQCCDAHVVEMSAGKSRVYAEALLDIVDLISEPVRPVRPALASGISQRPLLQKRLVDLMKRRFTPAMTPIARRVILVAGAVSLACHPSLFVNQPPQVKAATANAITEAMHRTLAERQEPPNASPPPEAQSPREAPTTQSLQDFSSHSSTEAVEEAQVNKESQEYEWATAISPNGRFHITVRRGYECELREVTSDQLHSLSAHQITCVAFTADSAQFVTGELNGTVRIWDSASGEMLQTLTKREAPIRSVCLAPSDRQLAVAGEDGLVELVSLTSPSDRHLLARLDVPVRCARFSPDGSRLGIVTDSWRASVSGKVVVYDVTTRAMLHRWQVAGPLGAVDFPSPDRLITVEWSGRVRQWILPGQNAQELPPLAKELVSAASFSVDSRVLEDLGR
jgi:beta-lactamase regulating signal transducer with metallopeptidase domain